VGTGAPLYRGFRFPTEIISHCVWLYYRFPLSFRDVEEMMLQRGIVVSHESIRQWCATFGQTYANALRHRRARPGTSGTSTRCSVSVSFGGFGLVRCQDRRR
jgi:putative transposase